MQKILSWSGMLLLLIGCGNQAEYYSGSEKAQVPQAAAGDQNGAADEEAQAQAAEQDTERKIIYEGRVLLVVENFEEMESAIPDLVEQFEGYLAEADINRTEGRRRSGRWVARIPAARFVDFLTEVSELGIAEQQEQTAQDVTMEYLDLEARIAAKKQLEQRILELLENREGKLSDVVEAERELARIRSEVESMEGRLRYLKNRTSFSTVTIDVREERDYVPPQAPDFGGRIAKAWLTSLRTLKEVGQNVVIAFVAFVPWMIPLAVIFGGLALIWKRLRRRKPVSAAS